MDYCVHMHEWKTCGIKWCHPQTKRKVRRETGIDQKKDVKEDDRSNKKEENKNSNFKATLEYVFAPQYFSDENPNSCLIM